MDSELDPENLARRLAAVGDVKVTSADAIKSGFCVAGLVGWLEQNGFDRRTSLHDGVSGLAILAKNNAYGNRAVNVALKKVEANGNGRR